MEWSSLLPGGTLLEQSLKWTGVFIALAGAGLSTPHGAKHLIGRTGMRVRTLFYGAWDWVGRRIPGMRRKILPTMASPTAIASGEAFGNLTTTIYSWTPDADIETRIEQLKQRMDHLAKLMTASLDGVYKSINDHDAELQRIDRLSRELGLDLTNRLERNDQKSAEVEATGLPVIAGGVFLSGVPTELALVPVIGWGVLLAALMVTAWAISASIHRGAWRRPWTPAH